MAIHILDPDVVNRIAAGEVLERPANLIKELVENSLDAGADEIEVTFSRGGREVVVSDNGSGMSAADLALAVERFATSKISASEDLYHLNSYGFRGEALASVAAVSRVRLTSRPPASADAHRVDSNFGRTETPVMVSGKVGTEVRVTDLFENVPARRRFLKSDASEHTLIKTTLKAIALSHPGVGFRVRCGDDLIFRWSKNQTLEARALDILPVRRLFRGEASVDGVTAEVLVAAPDDTQKLNRHVWTFVRDRWVQDRALGAAVGEGYRNLLMHGEYPVALVRLDLAPEDVDVNVHPTKAQVKFKDPQTAFRAVCRAVRGILETAPWLNHPVERSTLVTSPVDFTPRQQSLAAFAPQFSGAEFERTQFSTKAFPLAEVRRNVTIHSEPKAEVIDAPESFRWSGLQVLAQLNQTYVVAQNDEALYLIDQHAAHERVVFERLFASFRAGRMDVQNLLLPLTFDFSADEAESLHARAAEIEALGIMIERLAPETIAVRALPTLVNEDAVGSALRRLAAELVTNGGSGALDRTVGDVFASMACHSVIRAGQAQSPEQMRELLRQMDEYPLSSFCPHGRPVYVRKPFREIEREFGRTT